MNYNPQRHIRQQALYCPTCKHDTEQGIWVQAAISQVIFGKQVEKPAKEFADCLECGNTGSVAEKLAARK